MGVAPAFGRTSKLVRGPTFSAPRNCIRTMLALPHLPHTLCCVGVNSIYTSFFHENPRLELAQQANVEGSGVIQACRHKRASTHASVKGVGRLLGSPAMATCLR
jgi:hypothetical protein